MPEAGPAPAPVFDEASPVPGLALACDPIAGTPVDDGLADGEGALEPEAVVAVFMLEEETSDGFVPCMPVWVFALENELPTLVEAAELDPSPVEGLLSDKEPEGTEFDGPTDVPVGTAEAGSAPEIELPSEEAILEDSPSNRLAVGLAEPAVASPLAALDEPPDGPFPPEELSDTAVE